MRPIIFLHTAVVSIAAQNFVPTPEDLVVVLSDKYPGASISYKQTHICETTPGVKAYSGHVHLPSTLLADVPASFNISLFFWYFHARRNPSTAPTSIYVGGGPGSSALDDSNGFPCRVNPDANSTTLNEWSWNNNVNMLYVDQPVMTGFSYSTITNGIKELLRNNFVPISSVDQFTQTNSTTVPATLSSQDPSAGLNTTAQAARAMWHFAQVWFQEFPERNTTNQEISLWTVSYGGFFGPSIFAHFQRQSSLVANGTLKDTNAIPLKLATLGLQNACLDISLTGSFYPEYAYNNTYGIKAYSQDIHEAASANFTKPGGCSDLISACRTAVAQGDPLNYGNNQTVNALCSEATDYCYGVVQAAYTTYSNLAGFDISYINRVQYPPIDSSTYFNRPWVQSALGVPVNFTGGSLAVQLTFFALTGDPMRYDLTDLNYLLSTNVSVAMVYGDRDYRCNWFAGESVSLAATHPGAEDFRTAGYADLVTNGSYVGGKVRQSGNSLSFSRVYQAGHSVYAYQPETVYRIFERAIGGKDVATGLLDVNLDGNGYKSVGAASVRDVRQAAPESPESVCYLEIVGTCAANQVKALMGGTAVIADGKVVEPRPALEENGNGNETNGKSGNNGTIGDGNGQKNETSAAVRVRGSLNIAVWTVLVFVFGTLVL